MPPIRTSATLFGLLSVTGIRIGEALALDAPDLDLDRGLIDIRRGKFGKRRILPIKASTVAALRRHLSHPARRRSGADAGAVFVSVRGRRLLHRDALKTFGDLCETAGLVEPLPRPHDLRHSFAVLQVVECYRAQRAVDGMLPVLSTYMGHVSIESTRTYLRANGLLLQEACRRFELGTERLDEVLS